MYFPVRNVSSCLRFLFRLGSQVSFIRSAVSFIRSAVSFIRSEYSFSFSFGIFVFVSVFVPVFVFVLVLVFVLVQNIRSRPSPIRFGSRSRFLSSLRSRS